MRHEPTSLHQIRLVAALAHSAPDADVELTGIGRRWLVGFGRPGATIDPCGFRHLVIAAMRGCPVGVLPVQRVEFVGAMREIGAGVFQRRGDHGTERRWATFLDAPRVESIVAADDDAEAADALTARVSADEELGVTVVTIATTHPAFEHRLDVAALRLATTCLVEELIESSDREATP